MEAPLDVGQGGIGCDQGLCQNYLEEHILQLTELEGLHCLIRPSFNLLDSLLQEIITELPSYDLKRVHG